MHLSIGVIRAIENMKIINSLKLVQAYQDAPPDSEQHKLRLLEITAAALHTFAGAMYGVLHPEMSLKPDSPPLYSPESGDEPWFVEFYNTSYWCGYQRYPYGLLDVVGYWAETQFFGGVLLFERDKLTSEVPLSHLFGS